MYYLAVVVAAGGGAGGWRRVRRRCDGAGVGPGPPGQEPSWSPRWAGPSLGSGPGWAHCGTMPGPPPPPPRPDGGPGPAGGPHPGGGPGPGGRTQVTCQEHFLPSGH